MNPFSKVKKPGFEEVRDLVSQKSNPLSISHTVFSSRFHVCLPREAGNI